MKQGRAGCPTYEYTTGSLLAVTLDIGESLSTKEISSTVSGTTDAIATTVSIGTVLGTAVV